jgi:hypothetical protein
MSLRFLLQQAYLFSPGALQDMLLYSQLSEMRVAPSLSTTRTLTQIDTYFIHLENKLVRENSTYGYNLQCCRISFKVD